MTLSARSAGLAAFSACAAAITATALMLHAPRAVPEVTAEARPAVPLYSPRVLAFATPAVEVAVAQVNTVHALAYSPTAMQVAGNPHRYINSRVHWTCVVDLVPETTFANAKCGPHVPSFAQPPLSAYQMEHDPDAVAQSVRGAQISLRKVIGALGERALIILTGPVAELDHGQLIMIEGTVQTPIHGENAFGVIRAYPTVRIDRIVESRSTDNSQL